MMVLQIIVCSSSQKHLFILLLAGVYKDGRCARLEKLGVYRRPSSDTSRHISLVLMTTLNKILRSVSRKTRKNLKSLQKDGVDGSAIFFPWNDIRVSNLQVPTECDVADGKDLLTQQMMRTCSRKGAFFLHV